MTTTTPTDSTVPTAPAAAEDAPADPMAMLRSRSYLQVLTLAALIGVPVSAVAYFFLKLIGLLQQWFFTSLPKELGFAGAPAWWPLPLLAMAGLVVGATITFLPGEAGHRPAEGFKAGGAPTAAELPSVFLAALATLSLGVVLGPEAPLIGIGAGLGALAVHLATKDAPPTAAVVIASAGSFAAVSALLGSPIIGAFLLMEASGLGGPILGLVLVPGLLAAGIGTLIFIGLNSLTGFGSFSLSIPGLPPFSHPTGAMFAWAIAFGLGAAVLGTVIRLLALAIQPVAERRMLMIMPAIGLGVAGVAILFAEVSGHGVADVLFSGQAQLPEVVRHAPDWTVGGLVLLVACKSVAYGLSLSSFRGGPIFPAMFIGGVVGVAGSHLPGLSLVPAVAMGIGAMACIMLTLPMTSALLPTLLLSSNGLSLAPLIIVAVVVAYVAGAWLPTTPAELGKRRNRTAAAVPAVTPAGPG